MSSQGKLIIISGPSCIGKSPLVKLLQKLRPELLKDVAPLVLYNSRPPRPGEHDGKDYHFRSGDEIKGLKTKEDFVVMDVRGDLQGLDVAELNAALGESDVLFEGNPFIAATLLTNEKLRSIEKLSVFISPLSRDELSELRHAGQVNLESLVTDVMRRKLLRRMERHKGVLSLKDLEEVERRAGSAFGELKHARDFQYVLPNHDGEDSENWNAFYFPLGDARRVFLSVAGLLEGKEPVSAEDWKDFEL